MNSLHLRIKSTRQSLGLSQARLAADTGVSQPTVANWEAGSHIPRQKALERISAALGVEEDWLLSGKEDRALRSANQYLASPIRHIPIYSALTVAANPRDQQPKGFLPYPTENVDTFALIKAQESAIFILEPLTENISVSAPCIWMDGQVVTMSEYEIIEDKKSIMGRLRAEIKTY